MFFQEATPFSLNKIQVTKIIVMIFFMYIIRASVARGANFRTIFGKYLKKIVESKN